jgi:hypothetical protein
MDRLRRIPPWGWALIFSVAVCLPRLGSFGFWDPWELKLADQARQIARSGNLFDTTAGGLFPARKPMGPFLSALGIRLFGAGEWGARIFISLSALGALMAVYWAGAGLFRRRAALLGTLVLGSMTMFTLEARQLTSDAPLIAALALAMGGLGRYAWPPSGKRRFLDLGIGALGLVVGYLAGGALHGVVLPGIALLAALLVGYSLVVLDEKPTDGTDDLSAAGAGPDITAGKSIGWNTLRPGSRAFVPLVLLGLVCLALLIASLTNVVAGKYSALLGGAARGGIPAHKFEYLVRQLGFGLFPWSAVAVFALARPLIRLDQGEGAPTNSRLVFGQLYLLFFAALGFAISTYTVLILGDGRYVALPAIALAIGVFLDEALEGNRSEPVAGLLIATGTMMVARDFFLAPEELASVHLLDKVKWPPTVSIGYVLMVLGLLVGAGIYAALATRGRALGKVAQRDLSSARPWQRRVEPLIVEAGRWGLHAAVACALFFSFFLTQYLVPTLSTHFSFKPVLESYSKFAKSGEKIAKYRVEGHGTGFYGSQNMIELPTQDKLIDFLKDQSRVFALVSADDLAALDNGFKLAKHEYYVVDASSSRFLLMSNRLGPGEVDHNPLRKNVWMAPTPPAPGTSNWNPAEKPPWSWRIPVSATFGDAIELVGADFPPSLRRPGKIPLELTFRVKARPPGGLKIFVHFDGPAAPRVIGDHDPLGKAFPTSFWLPGEYIRDRHEVDVPLMTTPAGTYTVFVGFWPGGEGKRLKVTQGPNDGSDRIRLGTIEIK